MNLYHPYFFTSDYSSNAQKNKNKHKFMENTAIFREWWRSRLTLWSWNLHANKSGIVKAKSCKHFFFFWQVHFLIYSGSSIFPRSVLMKIGCLLFICTKKFKHKYFQQLACRLTGIYFSFLFLWKFNNVHFKNM